MRRMLLTALAVTIVVFSVGSDSSVTAQQSDPLIGKWNVNLAKSKYDPGPSPKSVTRSFVDRGNGVLLVTQEGANADGTPSYIAGAMKADGQDYPLATKGATGITTVALKRLDP